MYTEVMEITYSAGTVRTTPYNDPNMVQVHGDNRTLNDIITSLELAGVAEDRDYNDLAIYSSIDGYGDEFYLILDRATFALWFQFEVLNYLHITPEGYNV